MRLRLFILIIVALAFVVSMTPAARPSTVQSAQRATFAPEAATPTDAPYPAPADTPDRTPTPTMDAYPAPVSPAPRRNAAPVTGLQQRHSCAPPRWRARQSCAP